MTRIEEELATLHAVLRSSGKKISAAESITVGNIQAKIASMSGASDVFSGGITAYSIEEKVKLLSVDRAHAEEVDCVSRRVAGEMASGVAELFGCELAVATTGYAEPSNGIRPHAWIAVKICGRLATKSVKGGGTRVEVQTELADEAIRMIVECLRDLAVASDLDAPGEEFRAAILGVEPWLSDLS